MRKNYLVVHTASQRPSVLAVLTENELVMLDVSKPAKEVKCGDGTVMWLVNACFERLHVHIICCFVFPTNRTVFLTSPNHVNIPTSPHQSPSFNTVDSAHQNWSLLRPLSHCQTILQYRYTNTCTCIECVTKLHEMQNNWGEPELVPH